MLFTNDLILNFKSKIGPIVAGYDPAENPFFDITQNSSSFTVHYVKYIIIFRVK